MTRLGLLLAMLAGFAATPVYASKAADAPGVMAVQDDAHLFTEAGINAAKDVFQATTFHGSVRFTVHTVKDIPASKKSDFDQVKNDRNQLSRFVADWARELARSDAGRPDVFVLILVNDKGAWQVKCVADRESSRFRNFEDQKANDVARKFGDGFRAVKEKLLTGEQAKEEMGKALLNATSLVVETFRDTSVPNSKTAASTHDTNHKGGSNIMSYVCIGVCVLAGIWLVIGLIRAFTGGGMGGGGMGGGMGGYGGGGGFFSNLMGGMFGAMAGMWMYNNLFGGHDYHNDAMAGDNYGNETGDTGDGNYDDGAAATDGDWGDGGGSGGGDWGGDAGGGGDWGGGGGDFGGGGDW